MINFLPMRTLTRIVLAVTLITTAILSSPASAQSSATSSGGKLVLLIVVDQMRTDYLTRFDSLFIGGLARLSHNGFVFTNAFHNHAHTETAVGHATIATGSYPSRHGIVANSWFDDSLGRLVYCVEDSTATISGNSLLEGRSPINLRSGGIADWLNRNQPESKVYSLALKDRAAIAMGSYSTDGAYWYNSADGTMITSLFYTAVYPQWLADLNDYRVADDYYSGIWDRFAPLADYRFSGPDSVVNEADGKDIVFPHNFAPRENDDRKIFYDNLLATPFADHLLLRYARELIRAEQLGQDEFVDLLMIGFSAADYIGHYYGPRSQEVQDYYLRLDSYLGEFFAELDSTVGVGQYSIVLASDHGAMDLPEYSKAKGIDAGRIHPDSLKAAIMNAGSEAAKLLGLKNNPIRRIDRGVFLDCSEAAVNGKSEPAVQDAIAAELKKIPYVVDAYTTAEMSASGGSPRQYLQQFRNNYFDGRTAHVMYRLKENYIVDRNSTGSTHGSCYCYDTDVPIIFYGPAFKTSSSDLRIQTVDIAPTLIDLMGIASPGELDGQSLFQLIKK